MRSIALLITLISISMGFAAEQSITPHQIDDPRQDEGAVEQTLKQEVLKDENSKVLKHKAENVENSINKFNKKMEGKELQEFKNRATMHGNGIENPPHCQSENGNGLENFPHSSN